MELYQLDYFLEAAKQQNFSRAARGLNLAQAALSEQMRKLEVEFGVPLFVRGRRETVLTPAGEVLRQQVEPLLAHAAQVKRMMRDFLQMKSGRLVLAAIPSVSAYFMPQLITRFRQAHPGLELRLKEGTSSQIAGWVENGQAELGILQLPVAGAAFEVQTLFEESFLVVLPSGHRLTRQKKIRLEQLAEEAFVEYKGRARSVVHTACLEAGFEPQIACECGDLDTIRNLVGAGLGVAVLPAMGHSRPHEGTLVVPLREPLTRQVALLQRLKHPLSPGAEAMKNLITTRARKRRNPG